MPRRWKAFIVSCLYLVVSLSICGLLALLLPITQASWVQSLGGAGPITLKEPLVEARITTQPQDCTYSPDYWAANPERWPTEYIAAGAKLYLVEEAIAILVDTAILDTRMALERQLIAAKLNVSGGANVTQISAILQSADEWLTAYPLGSWIDDEQARYIESLGLMLQGYNEGRLGPGPCVVTVTPTATPIPSAAPEATLAPVLPALTCTYPLVYWMDSPEAWVVHEVQAGVLYTQPVALNILRAGATSMDVAILLTRQLIGARLNLAAGVDLVEWLAAVELSEDWLQQHPIGGTLSPEMENDGRVLLMFLEIINNGETGSGLCPEAKITPTSTVSLELTETGSPWLTCTLSPSSTPLPSTLPSQDPEPSFTPEAHTNCTLPAYYWRDHLDEWLAESLTLGGVEITQEQALALLQEMDSPNPSIRLIQEMIAAQLNLMHGADPTVVNAALQSADEFLVSHPLDSRLDEEQARYATYLARLLEDYNEGRRGPGICPATTTPIATLSPSATLVSTAQPSPSVIPTVLGTPGPSPSPTSELPETPTATDSEIQSSTPSPIPDMSGTPTPTASETPSPLLSPTSEAPETSTPTPTATPTATGIPAIQPGASPTKPSDARPSATPSPTGLWRLTSTPQPPIKGDFGG